MIRWPEWVVLLAVAFVHHPVAIPPVPADFAAPPPQAVVPHPALAAVAAPWVPTVTPLDPARIPLGWGPSVADWDDALATAAALDLDHVAGQVLVADYAGTSKRDIRTLVADHHLGGVILMRGAIGDADAVRGLTSAAQAGGADRDWPVIVSVDHEGGTVARLAGVLPGLPGFMSAGATRDKFLVRDVYGATGADMAQLGFTLNYAPVADMTIGLKDPIIRTRSAGSDSDNVTRTVIAAMDGMIDGGVVPTLKHFPGHGSVTTDSHVALPRQQQSLEELEQRDLIPFARAIDAGAPVVMMSHVALDEWGGTPATLTPEAYAYLRDELGFAGVIVTDALNMRAVADTHSPAQAAVKALQAGADVVLMPANVAQAHRGIVKAVESGALDRGRLNEAAARSILMMRWQATLSAQAEPGLAHGGYGRELAVAGATVIAPLCNRPLVGDEVSLRGGTVAERKTLARALQEHGVKMGDEGTTVALLGTSHKSADADVVVALDGPWGLAKSEARAYLALYGRSNDALVALADILVGESMGNARWPVPMKGLPYNPCPSPR